MLSERTIFARFCSDVRGQVAVIFGLAGAVLLLIVGLAVDTSRLYNVASRVQAGLDAAALAGAKEMSREGSDPARAQEAAAAYFTTYVKEISINGLSTRNFVAVPDPVNSLMRVSVEVTLPTTLGTLGNVKPSMTFTPTSEAVYKAQKVELAMVLDITGSMCMPCDKIDALKSAAKDIVDTLVAVRPEAGQIKVGLVPYSASVNAGGLAGAVRFGLLPDTCVVERAGASAYTDDAPGFGTFLGTSSAAANPQYFCPPSAVEPLVDITDPGAKAALKTGIDHLSTGGFTAGHIGAAWGWYLLSPKWAYLFPPASQPRAYSGDVVKAVILMTDGQFNTSYDNGPINAGCGAPGSWAAGSGCDQALQICANMKAEGIKIYSIAFQAPADAGEMLKECADPGSYYDTDTSGQLMSAFRDIANKLTNLRISS